MNLLNEFLAKLLSESQASKKAKAMGLVSMGFGRWGKDNKVTHKTEDGKLVALQQKTSVKKSPSKQVTAPEKVSRAAKKPDVPQAKEVPMSKASGKISPMSLAKGSAASDEDTLQRTESDMKSRGFSNKDDQTRFETFTSLWRAFLGAPSYEEQVKAVRALADQKLIQGGISGKKIYVHPNVGLPYKVMCGKSGNGTAVTKLINDIAQQEGIEIEPRDESKSSTLADISGKHNEAGVTAYLDPSRENKAAYKNYELKYGELGGDTADADRQNREAADVIKKSLPAGAKITHCSQVGGVGAKRLKELGIEPKTDPTDMLLDYEVDGKKYVMKISAKIYTNPRNITMKNSGLKSAGADYIGEPEGSGVDELWQNISKKYKWTSDMSDEERSERKRKLRTEYLQTFSQNMEKLTKTENGQKRLLDMWQKVHGCGKNVHTLVVDKKTGKSSLKSPEHYCDPKLPFKVKYDGVKVVIEMQTGGPQTLQIDLKTESSGDAKLLFRHIIRDKN